MDYSRKRKNYSGPSTPAPGTPKRGRRGYGQSWNPAARRRLNFGATNRSIMPKPINRTNLQVNDVSIGGDQSSSFSIINGSGLVYLLNGYELGNGNAHRHSNKTYTYKTMIRIALMGDSDYYASCYSQTFFWWLIYDQSSFADRPGANQILDLTKGPEAATLLRDQSDRFKVHAKGRKRLYSNSIVQSAKSSYIAGAPPTFPYMEGMFRTPSATEFKDEVTTGGYGDYKKGCLYFVIVPDIAWTNVKSGIRGKIRTYFKSKL
ncbi:CP [Soybean zhengqing-associated geminivirus]|nr:coat protein [Soybean yellow dwarf-associated geminivirus]URZ62314.1 coat protein [Soybean geminivirus A]UXP86046.1 V1 [Soybean stay-green associated virus]WAB00176.1 CP [Soybean zhengqing-associated geminivirus]WAQ80361.1 capsid protein [Soybean staygreen syndrome-associated geminivirus]